MAEVRMAKWETKCEMAEVRTSEMGTAEFETHP